MTRAVGEAVETAERLLLEEGRFRLEFDRPPERSPHPGGQDAFRIRAAFPWQSVPQVRVKLEITHDEPVLLTPARRPIIHGYEALGHALPPSELATYPLEEIVAERLRALRQTRRQIERRGWNKPRAGLLRPLVTAAAGSEADRPYGRRGHPGREDGRSKCRLRRG